MSAKDIEIIEITSQEPRGGPRGGPAGRWVNRGRGNPRGGTRGPFTGQPPPPYETIVVPIVPSAAEPQNANAPPQVQNVTHVHVTIGGGQGQPRGSGGGQRGGAARGNFSAQRGRGWSQGRAGAEGGEKSNRGGAQSSSGYQRGRGGTPRGATSGQGRGGFNNPPPPVSAPPQPPPPPPPPPRQEFTNPAVPFFATIIGGFTSSSRRITLVATPAARPRQFSVNLKSSSDFLFHFNPRFFNSTVVRNSTRGGSWQAEETTAASFPFVPNQMFSLMVTATGPVYNVSVNGQHFTAFAARDDQSLVSMLNIEGDIIVKNVIVE